MDTNKAILWQVHDREDSSLFRSRDESCEVTPPSVCARRKSVSRERSVLFLSVIVRTTNYLYIFPAVHNSLSWQFICTAEYSSTQAPSAINQQGNSLLPPEERCPKEFTLDLLFHHLCTKNQRSLSDNWLETRLANIWSSQRDAFMWLFVPPKQSLKNVSHRHSV